MLMLKTQSCDSTSRRKMGFAWNRDGSRGCRRRRSALSHIEMIDL
jgi:hypothetical protein